MRLLPALPILFGVAVLGGCQAEFDSPPPEPPAGQPFFVGAWAADAASCSTAAWQFTSVGLTTPGEVSCSFDAVTQTATGYQVAAICTAEAPPAPFTLDLSYAQYAEALIVEGGPFSPIALVACR